MGFRRRHDGYNNAPFGAAVRSLAEFSRHKQRPSLQLAVLLVVLWLALTGLNDWLFGLVAVVLAMMASVWLAPMQFTRFSLPGLVRFLPFFLHQSVAGGLDIARRALDPALPIDLYDAYYTLRLPPGQARTVFVGTVSLLPGTLSRDLQGDRLRVHSIAGDPSTDLAILEARIADLFGLPQPDQAADHSRGDG